jgi:ABC-type nickel/cobalt efflux system permease component RcnA
MRFVLSLLAMLFLAATLVAAPAMAQEASPEKPAITIDKRKLLVPPKAERNAPATSFWEDPVLWARDKQQAFYGSMSGAIRQIKAEGSYAATLTLLLLSFGYGVFHAAGPGHGKAVISAWLVATENDLRRGILISFLSALVQALTAIVIVSVLLIAVSSVSAAARDVAGFLESASYLMIAAMGAYLLWTAFRLFPARHAHPAGPAPLHRFDDFTPLKTVALDHVHGPDCGCGHTHLPNAKDLRGDWSFTRALSLAFAVGIRPCTGALLVLVFAYAIGLYWVGVASTFAMALGTFITVSLIATLAVYAKKLAMRVAGRDSRWITWLALGLRLGGGAVIVLLGGLLFVASLGSATAMI